jgi:hypothetical protein
MMHPPACCHDKIPLRRDFYLARPVFHMMLRRFAALLPGHVVGSKRQAKLLK